MAHTGRLQAGSGRATSDQVDHVRNRLGGRGDGRLWPAGQAGQEHPADLGLAVLDTEEDHAAWHHPGQVGRDGGDPEPGRDQVEFRQPVAGGVDDAGAAGQPRPHAEQRFRRRGRGGDPGGVGRLLGRNRAVLDLLADRFGPRVRPVVLSGVENEDRLAMSAAADGPVDVVLDLLPPRAPTSAVRAAAMMVREYGRGVLMGGVGMLGGDDLALPYPWLMRNSVTVRGQWMLPRTANPGMIHLVEAGLLDLTPERVTTFALDEINEAVAFAAAHPGPFERTILTPHKR